MVSFVRSVLRGRAPGDRDSAGPAGAQAAVMRESEGVSRKEAGSAAAWALSRGRRLLSSSGSVFHNWCLSPSRPEGKLCLRAFPPRSLSTVISPKMPGTLPWAEASKDALSAEPGSTLPSVRPHRSRSPRTQGAPSLHPAPSFVPGSPPCARDTCHVSGTSLCAQDCPCVPQTLSSMSPGQPLCPGHPRVPRTPTGQAGGTLARKED